MRRRVLLGIADIPPTASELVTLVKGPVVETGRGARNICATIVVPLLTGFKPVVSVTSVPSGVKFSDEVNKTARIEACATGGLVLASKDLLERLEHDDATALNLDPARLTYTALADLPSATEKARRDAPSIAVSEL